MKNTLPANKTKQVKMLIILVKLLLSLGMEGG